MSCSRLLDGGGGHVDCEVRAYISNSKRPANNKVNCADRAIEERGGDRETSSAGTLGTFKGIVSRDEYFFEKTM